MGNENWRQSFRHMPQQYPNFFTPEQKTGGRIGHQKSQEDTWNEWLQLPRSRVGNLNSVI